MVADEIAGNIADGGCLCRGIGRVVNGAAVRRPGRFGNRAVADEIAGDVADGGAAAVERTVVDGTALRSVEEISLNAVVDKVAVRLVIAAPFPPVCPKKLPVMSWPFMSSSSGSWLTAPSFMLYL